MPASLTPPMPKANRDLGIGFLNDLFYGRAYIAGPGEMSIPFLVDEKPTVVAVGSAGEQSGGVQKVLCGAVRLKSQRSPNPAGRNNSLAGSSSKRTQEMSGWPETTKAGLPWMNPPAAFVAASYRKSTPESRCEIPLRRRSIQTCVIWISKQIMLAYTLSNR